ncbi:MAG: hypothetical protein CMB80_00025 [Flammeovirgaceae bacterium]|nr:hypothetical protein [Flammeovirgaceae bacterium]|tara:strand:- start:1147 stop:1350 length:204 start_codon:yes stop_codon:yes gene_type:complete
MQLSKETSCRSCKRFDSDGGNAWCKAFPKVIPKKILTGEHDHTKPFKGDGGIRFEPIKVLTQQEVKQ